MKILLYIIVITGVVWILLVGVKVFLFPLLSQNQFFSKECTADSWLMVGTIENHTWKITNLVCK